MSIRKYKFVAPSVQTKEVDNSFRLRPQTGIGPVIIGRSQRGPSFTPVQADDFAQFVQMFGEPVPGGGGFVDNDVWRDGNKIGPTYAAYAAQAYLKNKGPVTFVRLAGDQHDNATTAGAAGWPQDSVFAPNSNDIENAGAYGLFLINSGTIDSFSKIDNSSMTGALGAIFYMGSGSTIRLAGTNVYGRRTINKVLSGACTPIQNEYADKTFLAVITEGTGESYSASFNFQPDSDKFIRKVFNTNPMLTNSTITDSTSNVYKKYWLGETYEDFVSRQVASGSVSGSVFGIIAPIASGSGNAHGGDFRFRGKRAKTGWIFSQDLSNAYDVYQPINMTKLFRFHTHTPDEWTQKNLKISIANVKQSKNLTNQYGTFDVEIRKVEDTDTSKKVVERFVGCSLNPFSSDYIAKKIGNRYREWDYTNRNFIEYGDYDNRSSFVYVEVHSDVDQGMTDPRLLPFGFYGTPRFKGVTMTRTYMLSTEDLRAGRVVPSNTFVRGSGSCAQAPSGSTTLNTLGTGICLGDQPNANSFL